eukprot:797159-Pleurochrysis_carterae.AAC.2
MDSPRRAARDASVLREVARMVAQKVCSKSTPGICEQPCTQSLALSEPLRFLLYTQISRTRDRPCGTDERSISSQLPLLAWLAISARSAAVQPSRSSRRACLRVLGSVLPGEASITLPEADGRSTVLVASHMVSSAAGVRLRRGSGESGSATSARRETSDSTMRVGGNESSARSAVAVSWVAALVDRRFGVLSEAGRPDVCSAAVETAASAMRLATACAMVRLRSGG